MGVQNLSTLFDRYFCGSLQLLCLSAKQIAIIPFNRIYKSKVISHVSTPWTMWILMFSSGRKKYKALTFWYFMFQLQKNIFRFSIPMFLYTLNLKIKHRIGIKRTQVILRDRYLVKRAGNVHEYKNQWQFVTILFGLWQLKEINLTLFHIFLNLLMTYAVLKSHCTQQEDFRSSKLQSHIWWIWVRF